MRHCDCRYAFWSEVISSIGATLVWLAILAVFVILVTR